MLESMGPLVVAGQAAAGLIALYAIMSDAQVRVSHVRHGLKTDFRSFAEYTYHRYFQHLGSFAALEPWIVWHCVSVYICIPPDATEGLLYCCSLLGLWLSTFSKLRALSSQP